MEQDWRMESKAWAPRTESPSARSVQVAWAPAMRPEAKDGWPPSRKLFGSPGCVLCLLTRAHPGLSYCPYKTAQEGREPNVLNVPGRKMLTMNPCGRTVQCNCKNTQHSLPGGPERKMQLLPRRPVASPCPSAAVWLGRVPSTSSLPQNLGNGFSRGCD